MGPEGIKALEENRRGQFLDISLDNDFFGFDIKSKGNRDFPGSLKVNNMSWNAGDMGSTLGLGRFHMLWGN